MASDFDPTKTWGLHEDDLYSIRVDNGAQKNDWWTHWFKREDGIQICGSYVTGGANPDTKYPQNYGRRCAKSGATAIIFPNGRCQKHGGAIKGSASKHGRYMQLKGPLKDATERAEANQALLNLKPLIALFDVRAEDLSNRMGEGSAGPAEWKAAREHWREYRRALSAEDKPKQDHHAKELGLLFDNARRTEDGWDKLLNVAERRLKRTEKAQALLISSANMVAQNDIRWTLSRIIDIVQEESHGTAAARILARVDKEVLARICTVEREEQQSTEGSRLLPRVQGEGAGVRDGDPGGKVLEGSARNLRGPVQAQEDGGEDVPRDREDAPSSGSSSDVPVHEEGRDRSVDGTDGSPSTEPPVGGDRKPTRPRSRPRK